MTKCDRIPLVFINITFEIRFPRKMGTYRNTNADGILLTFEPSLRRSVPSSVLRAIPPVSETSVVYRAVLYRRYNTDYKEGQVEP